MAFDISGQQEKIYQHLKKHGSLSQLEALGVYGIYRLAARVYEMRRKGVPIDSHNKADANGKVYASYFLNPDYVWRQAWRKDYDGGSLSASEAVYEVPVTVPEEEAEEAPAAASGGEFTLSNGHKVVLEDNGDSSFSIRVYDDTVEPMLLLATCTMAV